MNTVSAGIIPPSVLAYAMETARAEKISVAFVLRRMIALSIEADVRHSLRVAPRLEAAKALRKPDPYAGFA
jgi:hypothetical protein